MPAGTFGDVTISGHTYRVTITSETVRATRYAVSCPDRAPRSWRPGEVRVGIENVFACLTCRQHPGNPCIHIAIAQRFAAAEPVDRSPTAPTTLDAMRAALEVTEP